MRRGLASWYECIYSTGRVSISIEMRTSLQTTPRKESICIVRTAESDMWQTRILFLHSSVSGIGSIHTLSPNILTHLRPLVTILNIIILNKQFLHREIITGRLLDQRLRLLVL